jgi:hypothetical protein
LVPGFDKRDPRFLLALLRLAQIRYRAGKRPAGLRDPCLGIRQDAFEVRAILLDLAESVGEPCFLPGGGRQFAGQPGILVGEFGFPSGGGGQFAG